MSRTVFSFWLRLTAAFVAALVITPFAALVVPGESIHRIMTRTFLVAAIVAFAWGSGPVRAWPERSRGLGLVGPWRGKRFAAGAVVSIVLVIGLLLLEWALGGRGPAPEYKHAFAKHLFTAILSGVAVGFLEEILFRGYMNNVIGGVMSAFLYAIAHFFRPLHGSPPPGDGFDPLLAVRNLPLMVESFGHLQFATLGVLSLFLFGLALNRLRERTGSLYLGIGIHAGLVFALSFYRRFLHSVTTGDVWIHGGGRLHDGVLGTVALGLLLVAAWVAPLPGFARSQKE